MASVENLPKLKRDQLPAGDCLCNHCSAKCCKYFALPIDTPTTRTEWEYVRWFLMHESAALFKEEKSWYLLVQTRCKHLQSDNRCGIYHTRPQICREYSTDECEYDDDWIYEGFFEASEQVDEYAEAVLPRKKGKSIRGRRPELLPIVG